jgi:cytochrome o ubiquinol oxidase subunit 2
MRKKKPVLFILLFSAIILFIFLLMQPLSINYGGKLIALLFPEGSIALKERDLLLIIQAIMLLVVIPVYILTFIFSWKYRAHNPKGKYDPDLDDNKIAEFIWWGLPLLIIIVISILTWIRTEELDPYKPIASEKKTLKIQAVALQWKWLFIYPEENIATINFIQFPKDTPLHFEITSDAPMNSLWIPKLGGQIYAMPAMKTELHLIANEIGEFRGSSANISGEGFSKMHFIAKSSTEEEFHQWIQESQKAQQILNWETYTQLAKPGTEIPVKVYRLQDKDLFNQIIMKYTHPIKNET